MTSSETKVAVPVGPAYRARRITLRRVGWTGLGLVVAMAVVYALLPWLIPKRWLAHRIAAEITEAMNRATRIDGLRLSWTDGVVIEGLTIDRRPGFGTGPFVRVRRIQTGFAPLSALLGRPMDRLALAEPEVWVVIATEDGVQRLNIADLGAEGFQTAPAGEWSAVNAAIHIVEERVEASPDRMAVQSEDRRPREEVELRLGQLTCHLDPQTGRARWEIHGELPEADTRRPMTTRPAGTGGIATDGALTMPKLKEGVRLSGGGRITWDRLDLATLPVHLIPGSRLQRLTGWSAGMLDVRVHEDLHVDMRFRTTLSDVAVYRERRARPDRLASADLAADGRWNPNADVLVFSEFDGRLPGLRVWARKRSDRSPIRLALHGDRRINLDLAGHVDDLGRLRESLPELDILLGRQTQARGACRFEVSWQRMVTSDRLRLQIDATEAEIIRPEVICIRPGEPTSVRVDVAVDYKAERLDLREFQVRLGPFSVQARGQTPLQVVAAVDQGGRQGDDEGDIWRRALHETRGEMRLTAQAADRLCEFLPILTETLRDVRLVGPMSLTLGMDRTQAAPKSGRTAATVFRGYLNVPASSRFAVGGTFVKPAGESLSASVQLVLAQAPRGALREIGLDLRCGEGRARIDPASSRARLAVQRMPLEQPAGASNDGAADQARFMAHGYVTATLEVEKIEALLAAMPRLARRWRRDGGGQGLTGDCTLKVAANVANLAFGEQVRPELWRIHVDVEAAKLAVDLGERFRKPAGEGASVALDYSYDRSLPRRRHRQTASFELSGVTGRWAYAWGNGYEQAALDIDASDVPTALAHVPRAVDLARPYRLRGGASVAVRSQRDPRRHVLSVESDATRLGVHLPGAEPIDKSPGVPCRVAATLESLPGPESEPHEMTIRQFVASIGSSQIRATAGRIVTRPETYQKLTGDSLLARHPRWWLTASPFQEVRLSTTGTIVFDGTLRSLSPAIDRLARRYDLIGRAEAAIDLAVDRQGLRLTGRIDADRININASPHLVKPPGTRLGMTFDVASREDPGRPGTTTGFVVHECGLRAWDMRFDGSGDFWLQHETEAGLPRLGGFAMSATCEVPELAHLQKLVPSLLAEPLTGSVEGDVSLAAEGGRFRLGTSTLTARDVRTRLAGEPIELDGLVTVSSDRIDSEELRIRLGSNRLKFAGHIEDLSRNPRGSVFVIADELDLDELRRFSGQLQGAEAASKPAATRTSDEQRIIKAQPIFAFLKRCDLTGRAHIGRARVTGEKTKQVFAVDELVSDFKLAAGRVVVPFRCALNGGLVDGEFTLTADRRNPYFDLKYKAVGIAAEDNVKAMVLYDFPGLHARGPVTLIDATHQRFFHEPGVLNYPVGEGDWIIDGGAYVGRAAPLWLTRIFPGLNTARYEFTRMHDWFKKHVDGRVDHHMIYQGAVYNIYMKGYSLATNGRSHYEVGIDLLAGYESRYWSETGQGRVALFTADARVEDGVEVEKIIRFVPLHRVITDVFLRNNVVTAAYYALKKQVSGRE